MKLDIPVRCKKCGGRMYCVSYDVIFKILKSEKRNEDEFRSILELLKIHLRIRYDVDSQSGNIFEDLAAMIRKILHEKYTINEPPSSPDLKAIEMIISLKEITPLEVSVAESLPSILRLG